MNIGLIAHDAKKKLMQNFCIAYRGILGKNQLFATGTTGRLIEEVTNLTVHKYIAGHLGGEQQLGSQIENNDLDMVIFLRDLFIQRFMSLISIIYLLCVIHTTFRLQPTLPQRSFLLRHLTEETLIGVNFTNNRGYYEV